MSDKIIFKKFNALVPMVKDRWTPIYLEHGRVEVDNYSIKWVDSNGNTTAIPVAMISCILLGPGTTITHAAIASCSKTNTPVAWIGEDGLYFYAFGVSVNERCETSIRHASLVSSKASRLNVARKMFSIRFPDIDVSKYELQSLMGMEGNRVRDTYRHFAEQYKVDWACRNTNGIYGIEVDDLNKSINILNFNLYCICLSAIVTMGYIPSLGFIHSDGKIPFVYDIADLYKTNTSVEIAFSVFSRTRKYHKALLTQEFSQRIADIGLLKKLPRDLESLIC